MIELLYNHFASETGLLAWLASIKVRGGRISQPLDGTEIANSRGSEGIFKDNTATAAFLAEDFAYALNFLR